MKSILNKDKEKRLAMRPAIHQSKLAGFVSRKHCSQTYLELSMCRKWDGYQIVYFSTEDHMLFTKKQSYGF